MVFENVDTFLAVVDQGSIARGAASLYIGQETASQRIRHLEDELGVTLLFRQAGVRQLSLTPEGERFLDIARQWVSLQQQALGIRELGLRRRLRVSATELHCRFYLEDFFPAFVEGNPDIELYLQTEHASETYRLVEQQLIDIGLVASVHQSAAVSVRPLFSERMAVVCHEGELFLDTCDLCDLDPRREVRALWSAEFDRWHERTVANVPPLVTVGSASMIARHLSLPESWAFTTERLALDAERRGGNLRAIALDDPSVPERTTYLALYAAGKPWLREVAGRFSDALVEHLATMPEVTMLFRR